MLPVGREVESQASPTQMTRTYTEGHGALPAKERGHSGPKRLARVSRRKPARRAGGGGALPHLPLYPITALSPAGSSE